MEKHFGQLIFTDHALDRTKLRSLSKETIAKVLTHPDKTFPAGKPETIKFIRTLEGRTIHVIGTFLPDQKKWLIISVWVRGEDDPVPIVWKLITLPFVLVANVAAIIWSYIRKSK